MMLLKILLVFVALTGAIKLPEAYLSELEKYIPSDKLLASAKEIEARVNQVLTHSSTDFHTFYAHITQLRGELEGKLTRHCGEDQQCLRGCGLLIDVLELGYRERSLERGLLKAPTSLERGVLTHMLYFRNYEHTFTFRPNFYYKMMNFKECSSAYNLGYLQLWHNLSPRRPFEMVFDLVGERHALFLKQFIQRSAGFNLNRLHVLSHFYPRLHSGTVPIIPSSASAWYLKMSGRQPAPTNSLSALTVFMKDFVSTPLSHFKDHPELLNMNNYRNLVMDLLFAHQRLLEFDFRKLKMSERLKYLKLDVFQLYTTLEEEVYPKVLNYLIDSIVPFHYANVKPSVELRMNTGTHMIDRWEVFLVEFEVSKDIVFTVSITGSILRVFILCANRSLAVGSCEDIEKEIGNILMLKLIFTEDVLQSLLKDKIIREDLDVSLESQS